MMALLPLLLEFGECRCLMQTHRCDGRALAVQLLSPNGLPSMGDGEQGTAGGHGHMDEGDIFMMNKVSEGEQGGAETGMHTAKAIFPAFL